MKETYDQIIGDLLTAVPLLPDETNNFSRPVRAAAWGLLARIYLALQDYPQAMMCAGSSLKSRSSLLDYNELPVNQASPMPAADANPEIIFHNTVSTTTVFNASRTRVDSLLFKSYHARDLRKQAFFVVNPDQSASFNGSYYKRTTYTIFNGITTAEMHLVKAEGLARKEDVGPAMDN